MRKEQLLALVELLTDDDSTTVTSELKTFEPTFPFEGPVAIRTVTLYYTGIVDRIEGGFVVLREAAWIPDTGRWSTFLSEGTPNEVEPFPDEAAISLGAIVDVAPWTAALPRKVK